MKNIKKTISVLAVILMAANTVYADEALDKELWKNAVDWCNIRGTKEFVAKGGDINQTNNDGVSLFSATAIEAIKVSQVCANVANYLSSIGAMDSGHFAKVADVYRLNKPLIYENEHLLVGVLGYYLDGALTSSVLNKTGDDIYILGHTSIVNGVKYSHEWRKSEEYPDGKLVVKPNKELTGFYFAFNPENSEHHTKVANNKLEFTGEYTLEYEYKGKRYEFEVPKTTKEIDMDYKLKY
ncbi:MAG: hypothetical protein LBJ88_04200 [Campylobacteraceae bacterium]|jgi:hypothetical protein|nr:hypothetical protein [Campylobacteraceae bacterium]